MIDLEFEAAKRAMEYAKKGSRSKEYKNLCKSFPAMIMSNGLAQSIAFYEAKGKAEHKEVLQNVRNEFELFIKRNNISITKTIDFSDLLLSLDINKYIHFEADLLNTLKWLRRYVDIYCKDNKDVI